MHFREISKLLGKPRMHSIVSLFITSRCRRLKSIILGLLDVTSSAVDLGSSIIAQICVLGNLADNAERPSETANACLLIEKVMLK